MAANHSNTNRVITILIQSAKTYFQDIFVMLLGHVIKDMTSSLFSWHKCYDFILQNLVLLVNEIVHYKYNELECAVLRRGCYFEYLSLNNIYTHHLFRQRKTQRNTRTQKPLIQKTSTTE